MKNVIKKGIEPNKILRIAEIVLAVLLLAGSVVSGAYAASAIGTDPGEVKYVGDVMLFRDREAEDYDENCTVCDVTFVNGDREMVISYPYEEYVELSADAILASEYETAGGVSLLFDHQDITSQELSETYRQTMVNRNMPVFNLAISLLILDISLLVVLLFSTYFTTYEKCWFMGIMVLATVFAVLFPEESANGINGVVIMLLYLLDIFLNILCELLISKQSRYNFLVSVLVEITEIVICLVLMYRFATMAVTLLFWLPIDIISYINWSRHLDDDRQELTVVRKLTGWQEILIVAAIVVWTVVVGYFLSGLDIATDFYNNKALETAIIYIDACASAVGVANGLFILFRLREQWIAWYICAAMEAVINILSGQYVLLILKLGYFTNTTYGYIKWSRYIREHSTEKPSLF